jgi:hypothetical protein
LYFDQYKYLDITELKLNTRFANAIKRRWESEVMPFIHIKSLPLDKPINIQNTVVEISKDFAIETGISLEHVTVTWTYFQAGHYAAGGKVSANQADDSHPLLIDVLAPDFNSQTQLEKMLSIIANSVSRHTGISVTNIFIHYREASSARVFDSGVISRW